MADLAQAAAAVWYGRGPLARATRGLLAPAALAYEGAVRMRGALYDAGILRSHPVALPTLGVGNLTVGGTGKTPVSSWFARRLLDGGGRPAIVLRGYGDDEPLVHRLLAPAVEVVVDADRVRGVAAAAARGADVAVLDDAFQHRRARRLADVVLVSAEHADGTRRLLPAGPYREPVAALARAAVIVVTRKSATFVAATAAADWARPRARNVPTCVVALVLDALRSWSAVGTGATEPVSGIAGRRVLAVAAVGAPEAFFAQLAQAEVNVMPVAFADHHAFTRADAASLARRAEREPGVERVVCTLKDAVKLGPLWPDRAPPLWYVSQRVVVESGADVLDALVARLLDARAHAIDTTGRGRPS